MSGPSGERELESFVTLILAHLAPALAKAHDELYPERGPEQLPLSLTLLYPWIPARSIGDADVAELRSFFAERQPLRFALTRLDVFPEAVVYAVPEPDDELRSTLRALWARFPHYPPYGEPGSDPPPHATLGRLTGDQAITLAQARKRVEGLLPVSFVVSEAMLMEEFEPDRYRPREPLPLGVR